MLPAQSNSCRTPPPPFTAYEITFCVSFSFAFFSLFPNPFFPPTPTPPPLKSPMAITWFFLRRGPKSTPILLPALPLFSLVLNCPISRSTSRYFSHFYPVSVCFEEIRDPFIQRNLIIFGPTTSPSRKGLSWSKRLDVLLLSKPMILYLTPSSLFPPLPFFC